MPYSRHDWVDVGATIEGIRRWVEIESPTGEVAAVNRMIDRVAADLAGVPVRIERQPGRPGFGDTLVARTDGDGAGILILSHIDSVHPIGTLKTSPCRRDSDRLYGPGIYDMKGGAYLALDAFRRVLREKTARLPITYLFTPDEEVGSPCSRERIEREARRARYVLVTEPARDGGKVVTARKGVGRFEAAATGVPAHSGSRHRDGHSAIDEMARLNRPPFKKTPAGAALFHHAQELAREMGFELAEAATTGGGSDGNFTAALSVPTLDGLGIDGDGAHTGWEHALVSSIEPRTRLMQRLLETLE